MAAQSTGGGPEHLHRTAPGGRAAPHSLIPGAQHWPRQGSRDVKTPTTDTHQGPGPLNKEACWELLFLRHSSCPQGFRTHQDKTENPEKGPTTVSY